MSLARHALGIGVLGLLLVGGGARLAAAPAPEAPGEPLASWNDGAAKKAILSFVQRVTAEGGPDFVAVDERIAVFDNDGTLWVEQPLYTQLAFALDRVKTLAPQHPEWQAKEPFKSVLAGDVKQALAGGEKQVFELIAATHMGKTTEEFDGIVRSWIATAVHPTLKRPYTACVYKPMLELLAYLRGAGFKTWIVTGGGLEFVRPWCEAVYGIPPEQVVGSRVKLKYELRGDVPTLMRLPEIDHVDDGPGKPVGIQQAIGRRPIAAFGNSDGDYPMLEWTTAGKGARLGLLVRHTDKEREWAYDRESHIGRLDKALTAAPANGWVVVDMRTDWKTIYP
jgi:phosphoglycolate phosphatase-like HAD superfamily hydrolase